MKTQAPTKSYTLASIAALIIGAGAYGIGLFNTDMALNEKGYYLCIILYGLFSMVSLQKTIRDKAEGIATSKIYYSISWASAGISIALLAIGLFNAELLLSEKGFYAMAYVLSIFAAVTVQKNVRDNQAFASQEITTAEPLQDEFIAE
ncbi:inner membrane protein YiaA [Paraglaciecola arctica]|uniref:Inner membrane protein yiaA n=1 Tax=Paraglaciecola arctica BSs20135 TaxID=493475 RepID=K6Z1A5_9ALTE|nr:inner membrane protein YiaA [Paraglaciecola arctica]GAC17250.1 inner membrane protein yiaA [Paraglaciecola arctica BSs20135]